MVRVGLRKVHDIPIFHPFRYDGKVRRLRHDTDKRQDIFVLEPFPPDNFFDQELRTLHEGPSVIRGKELYTLYIRSAFPASVALSFLTATWRPSRVALCTSENPPRALGVVAHSSGVGAIEKEDGRKPKTEHNFRRHLRKCFRFFWWRSPRPRV